MKTRPLGRTGLEVSEIGLGGIKFDDVSQEQVTALVQNAIDREINIIDTARNYASSEVKLGRALEGRREEVILSSKSQARTGEGIRAELETSLRNLRTDWIDIYITHNLRLPENYDKAVGEGGAVAELERAREEGLIRHIGISCHRYEETFLRAIHSGRFDLIMVAYNLLNDELMDREVMPRASEEGLGVLVMKPLGGGVLAEAGSKLTLPGERTPERPLEPADAIRFVLANEDVDSAVVGMKSVEELEQDLLTVTEPQRLSEEELGAMREAAAKLGKDFCRACGYCQPCPQGILIPIVLRHLFYHNRFGLEEWAQGRYGMVEVKANECVRCGECEEKCPYDLPIPDLLEEAHRKLA